MTTPSTPEQDQKARDADIAMKALLMADQQPGAATAYVEKALVHMRKAGMNFQTILDAALNSDAKDQEWQEKFDAVIAENDRFRARYNARQALKNMVTFIPRKIGEAANDMIGADNIRHIGRVVRNLVMISAFPVTYPIVRAFTPPSQRGERRPFQAWLYGGMTYILVTGIAGYTFLVNKQKDRLQDFGSFETQTMENIALGKEKIPADHLVQAPDKYGSTTPATYMVLKDDEDVVYSSRLIKVGDEWKVPVCHVFRANAYPVKDGAIDRDSEDAVKFSKDMNCRAATEAELRMAQARGPQ